MNKNVKKLHLHRETLRNLTERNLQKAVGGGPLTNFRTCAGWTEAYATCDCSFPETITCC